MNPQTQDVLRHQRVRITDISAAVSVTPNLMDLWQRVVNTDNLVRQLHLV